MALALVGGAALGAPFGLALQEFYAVVKDAVKEARMFKPHLESLQSKLETLNEWVDQIRDLNVVVGHKEEETKNFIRLMKEGKELVEKCLKIGKWNPKKLKYGSKLSKFEEGVQKVIDSFVPLFQARNGLENLALSDNIQTTVNKNSAVSNDIQTTVNKNLAISSDVQTTVNKNLAVSSDIHTTVNKIYEGQNLGFRNIGLSCAVPPAPNFTVGLDVHITELKRKLLNEKISLLVVTGPGGRGKTTLVKKLCQDEKIQGVFEENIFFVLVSETPNPQVIAHDLLSHMGNQVPQFQSDEDAVNRVGAMFKLIQKPILLIMDDVWSSSEFLVKKFKFDISNYQILVTSRFEIGGNTYQYTLPSLNDEHAKTLLCQSAELKDGSSSIPNKYIEKVLRACGGHPLALEVIGRSLCGRSIEAWQIWAIKQSQGRSTLGSSSELLDCLQRSLNVLDDDMKECFLDLGLFPEDKSIPVKMFVAMWTEFYNLQDEIEAIDILDKISFQNLVSLYRTRTNVIGIAKDYSGDFILQHDLLRELAIYHSSQGPLEQRKRLIVDIRKEDSPNWLLECKSLPIKARILSITTDKKFSSSWCHIQSFEVEVLVLNFQTENSILSEFLPKMPKVKVLIVTNYGLSCAKLINFRLFEFARDLRKIILKNVSIPSLFMDNIRHTFGNCNMEISNAFPNLVDIDIDFCNCLEELPTWLCEITCLKKVSITRYNLSTLPQRFGELTKLEVLRLESCSLLELPESITSFHKLSILDIYNCWKFINLPEHIGDLKNLEVLRLESCNLSTLPQRFGELTNLEVLRLRSCFWLELPESITSLHKLSLLDISYLNITKLPEHIGELYNLKELHMEGCSELHEKLPPSTFDMKLLELVTCDVAGVNLWEPIKKELTNLKVKVVSNFLERKRQEKIRIQEKIRVALYVQKKAMSFIDGCEARSLSGDL